MSDLTNRVANEINDSVYLRCFFKDITQTLDFFRKKNEIITLKDKEDVANHILKIISITSINENHQEISDLFYKEIKMDLLNDKEIDIDDLLEKNDKYVLYNQLSKYVKNDDEEENSDYKSIINKSVLNKKQKI